FDVLGQGFGGGGILSASLGGQGLAVSNRQDHQFTALAPGAGNPGGPVHVQVEGASADGPPLFVTDPGPPPPPPPPPGDLKVSLKTMRFHNGLLYLWAYVNDAQGKPVPATCTGTAGGTALPEKRTAPFGGCFWYLHVPSGIMTVSVTARALDGTRTGTGQITVPGDSQ
ncbi:MAG TPA: hypothetical protein VNM37_01555, partial [Candidatus Dormibacteraeota bacterium]|nr:hypothetical protein [Candidatus Dormibacteraeota bacterium]